MNSKYLNWLLYWSIFQIAIGSIGWVISQTADYEDSGVLFWRVLTNEWLSWGLLLLAAWLVASSISYSISIVNDNLSRLLTSKGIVALNSEGDEPAPKPKAKVSSLPKEQEVDEYQFSQADTNLRADKRQILMLGKDFGAWESAGHPDISAWDGETQFTEWLRERNRFLGH
jgi:hypothetical protein